MSRTWARRGLGPRVDCGPCGKQLHPTRKAALDAAAHTYAVDGRQCTTYRCPEQPGYHLTTAKKVP